MLSKTVIIQTLALSTVSALALATPVVAAQAIANAATKVAAAEAEVKSEIIVTGS